MVRSMRPDELTPELSFGAKVAAAYYNISPSEYVRISVQKNLDQLADSNPLMREILTIKR